MITNFLYFILDYNNTENLGIGYVSMSYFHTDEYERFRWTNGNWQIGNSKATFVCERGKYFVLMQSCLRKNLFFKDKI